MGLTPRTRGSRTRHRNIRIVAVPKSTETWVNSLRRTKDVSALLDTTRDLGTNRTEPFGSPSKMRISGIIAVNHVTAPPMTMYLSCFRVCTIKFAGGVSIGGRAPEVGRVVMGNSYKMVCGVSSRLPTATSASIENVSRLGERLQDSSKFTCYSA